MKLRFKPTTSSAYTDREKAFVESWSGHQVYAAGLQVFARRFDVIVFDMKAMALVQIGVNCIDFEASNWPATWMLGNK